MVGKYPKASIKDEQEVPKRVNIDRKAKLIVMAELILCPRAENLRVARIKQWLRPKQWTISTPGGANRI